jgi:hypothetical protein
MTLNKRVQQQQDVLLKMVNMMGQLRKSGCDLDCYTEEMHAVRAAIHSARIKHNEMLKVEIK